MKLSAPTSTRPQRLRWPPHRRAPVSGKHFKANGNDEIAGIVDLLRGSVIARLDTMYAEEEWGKLLGRDHPDPSIRAASMANFQRTMLLFFPEEFGEPGDKLPPGIIPAAGPRRVGNDRMKRYGEALQGVTS